MTKKAATRELKKAVNNILEREERLRSGRTSGQCPNNFQGSTTQASDVTSQPACVGNPQPINVTEFGPMGGGGILAATCTYTSGGTITDADVKINTNFEWWEGTGGCSGRRSASRACRPTSTATPSASVTSTESPATATSR